MSKLEVKEIGPISGETDLKLGQSGGTVTLADGATAVGFGPEYPIGQVRAWVNFNGTGAVAIRGSMNVSSVTDNGTGDYTVNLTTAMPDTNYAVMATIPIHKTALAPVSPSYSNNIQPNSNILNTNNFGLLTTLNNAPTDYGHLHAILVG